MMNDPNTLFDAYIERKPRCRAVQVTHDNVWDVAQTLIERGYDVAVRSAKGMLFLEVQRDDTHFTVDVLKYDALKLRGDGYSVEYIPGQDFRSEWERENS